MDLGLKGKRGLITAASGGLGFATAAELVKEGAQIVICGRSEDKCAQAVERLNEMAANGGKAHGRAVDVADAEQVANLVAETAEQLGGIDLLFTNAGGPPGGTFESTDLDAWQKGIDLTLMSTVHLIRESLPHLKASDAASVLTVTSISVKQPVDNLFLSNAIRPAVIGVTKAISMELGGEGIRANSILPGWTLTERVDYLLNFRAEQNGTSVDEEAAKISTNIPMKRIGQPEEFGKVAAFLLSPAASYVSGVMMQVDGGIFRGLM